MKAIDLMKDLGEGFGEEEMSPEWPRCAESSQLDGYTLTKTHGQAVWAGARALEKVLELHDSESSHYSPFAGRTVTTCGACGEPRPCPTVTVITAELEIKE